MNKYLPSIEISHYEQGEPVFGRNPEVYDFNFETETAVIDLADYADFATSIELLQNGWRHAYLWGDLVNLPASIPEEVADDLEWPYFDSGFRCKTIFVRPVIFEDGFLAAHYAACHPDGQVYSVLSDFTESNNEEITFEFLYELASDPPNLLQDDRVSLTNDEKAAMLELNNALHDGVIENLLTYIKSV